MIHEIEGGRGGGGISRAMAGGLRHSQVQWTLLLLLITTTITP